MPASVVVRGLQKQYGPVSAVRDVSFDIQPGEIFGLIGPNGAGKTTTIECILGLRHPDAGTIEVCGIDARRHPREVKQKIGAALQTTALQDRITPREALDLFCSFYRQRASTSELLDRFSLDDKADAAFDTLSGGQRQRLALALAFVNMPELVFLDEPTAGVDAHSRRELRRAIARMRADGHTVFLTTHDIDDAEALCDRVAIIDRGVTIASGTPRTIIGQSHAVPAVSLEISAPVDAAWLGAMPGVSDLVCDGTRARFRATDIGRIVGEITRGLEARRIDLVELHVQKASLEDVFVELTGGDHAAPAALEAR